MRLDSGDLAEHARNVRGILDAAGLLTLEDDPVLANASREPLIRQVMQGGRRTAHLPDLAEAREHAAAQMARLPEPLRRLRADASYPVAVSDALRALAREVDKSA